MDRRLETINPADKGISLGRSKKSKDQAIPLSFHSNRMRDRAAALAVTLVTLAVGAAGLEAISRKEPIPNADQVYDGVVQIMRESPKGTELTLRTSPEIPHGSSAEPNTVNWPFQENTIYISNPKIVLGDDPQAEDFSQAPWVEIRLPQGEEIYANFTAATYPMVQRHGDEGTFIDGQETSDGGFVIDGGDKLQPDQLGLITFQPPPTSAAPSPSK